MQGDIMKESMEVAKTLAFSLLTKEEVLAITKNTEESKMQGIHIHVPEGATPKDGPSAGTAITLVIYSLLTNKKIKNNIAITGEICLQGKISAIGGLDLKIIGGLRAGVTTFYYPKDNAKDYKLFCEKYYNKLDGCIFIELENIEHAIEEIIL
jgi:ATP-dependent Lon protease